MAPGRLRTAGVLLLASFVAGLAWAFAPMPAPALDRDHLMPAFEDGDFPDALFRGTTQGEGGVHGAHDPGAGAPATDATPVNAAKVGSYDALRALAGAPGQAASLVDPPRSGHFLYSRIEPHGFGDDGGLVIRAANGWWLRQFPYDENRPIELDWFETVYDGADIAPVLGRIAWSFEAFYVRVPSRPMTLYSSFLDFGRGRADAPAIRADDLSVKVGDGVMRVASRTADFVDSGFRPGMKVRLAGFDKVYNNRVATIADGGVRRDQLTLIADGGRSAKAQTATVAQVRPPDRFRLVESNAPVTIRQKPPFLELGELAWTRDRAVPGGFVYRAALPWPATQIVADLGAGVVALPGAQGSAPTAVGHWRYDAEAGALALALPADPGDTAGRIVPGDAGMDLRAARWRQVAGPVWETTDVPGQPAQLFAHHPAVGYAVNFGVPRFGDRRSVNALAAVDKDWEWFYDRNRHTLRVRFPDGTGDPNGREGFVLYRDRDMTAMWSLPWQRDVFIGGPRYTLTFKGTYRRYGDRYRYRGGPWRPAPDGRFFPIKSAKPYVLVLSGSRARIHVRVEDVIRGGIEATGFDVVEASGEVHNAAIGARYSNRMHLGILGRPETALRVNHARPVELNREGEPARIPDYGSRSGGTFAGIGLKQVTGRYEGRYGNIGVGGFNVTFGDGKDAPLEVVLIDPFKQPVRGGGTVDAFDKRFWQSAKVDGAGSAASFLRIKEVNTDGLIGAPNAALMSLEATSDSPTETKTNAGMHMELVDVRHPILLNRTEDTGDCRLDLDNPDLDKRNMCADVSQFSTVVGTTASRITAQDHDRLGTPAEPLSVGMVRIKSGLRWSYRPKYHAVGVVIENATFPATRPDGRPYAGPRITIDAGAGYAEERWAPPPARITASDIAVDMVDGRWALVSKHTDFVKAGFAAGRPVTISGTRDNDGRYTVRASAGHGVKKTALFLDVPEGTLGRERAGSRVSVVQPNIVDGRLHMTGMRFAKEAKPLVIRSTAPERLTFRITGIGPAGAQSETLTMSGREGTSGKTWKEIKEIAVTAGTAAGDLRAGLDAPIILRDVTFTGQGAQTVLHVGNESRPDVPVHIEISDLRAPPGSRITVDDPENVHIRLDGVAVDRYPVILGPPGSRAATR